MKACVITVEFVSGCDCTPDGLCEPLLLKQVVELVGRYKFHLYLQDIHFEKVPEHFRGDTVFWSPSKDPHLFAYSCRVNLLAQCLRGFAGSLDESSFNLDSKNSVITFCKGRG